MDHPLLAWVLADNPGPFTLDGTRSWIVGRRRPAVIDPGPRDRDHVARLADAVAWMEPEGPVRLLLTHGHGDHAGATESLELTLEARGLAVEVRGVGSDRARSLAEGEAVETDAGALVALETPGHTCRHLAFHLPEAGVVFVGDLLLGEGHTTWVAEYPGCVADYLDSLERLRSLEADVLIPTHGPPLDDPLEALGRFEAHRRQRIAQVERVLEEAPGADTAEILERVYGDEVPPGLREAALRSVEALVHHVRGEGRG